MKKTTSRILRRVTTLFFALVIMLSVTPPVMASELQSTTKAASTEYNDDTLRAEYLAYTGAKLVDVNGDKFCTLTVGKGNRVIFFLPGFGLTSPVIDLKPFAKALSEKGFKVIIVEPLGTGMSDIPETKRTIEQITEELHGLVQKMGYNEYAIMAHSIGGAYGLYYANRYKSEVNAFISLDASVADQLENTILSQLESMGMEQLISLIDSGQEVPSDYYLSSIYDHNYTAKEESFIRNIFLNRQINASYKSELAELNNNLTKCKGIKFAYPCKYLGFLSELNLAVYSATLKMESIEGIDEILAESMSSFAPSPSIRKVTKKDLTDPNGWAAIHIKTYNTDNPANKTYVVPSNHYIHYSQEWPNMVDIIADWYKTSLG